MKENTSNDAREIKVDMGMEETRSRQCVGGNGVEHVRQNHGQQVAGKTLARNNVKLS